LRAARGAAGDDALLHAVQQQPPGYGILVSHQVNIDDLRR
jgi:hypothetical protein